MKTHLLYTYYIFVPHKLNAKDTTHAIKIILIFENIFQYGCVYDLYFLYDYVIIRLNY